MLTAVSPSAAAATDDDDLEVPASPAAAPSAAPAASDTAPAAAPASAPGPSAATTRIAELERRLAALEQRAVAPPAPVAPTPEKPKPVAPKKPEPPRDTTPFVPVIPRGFSIGAYIQADYHADQTSDDQLQQTNVPVNQNRFYLRRGRVRFDRGWEYAAATLELDANTVGAPVLGIRKAEGSLLYRGGNGDRLPPMVMLTAGILDLPFGFELIEADRAAPFMERSLASSALFPTKTDAGVKLSGAIAFLRYAVAVSNGEPVDAKGFPRDPNSAKDVTGRFGAVVPVGDRFEITGGASFATGKGFHPGTPARKQGLIWNDRNEDGVETADEVEGVAASGALPSRNFNRWAFGLDLGVRFQTSLGETHVYGEVYAASNYDRGFLVSDPLGPASADTRQLGGYAAITQDITRWGFAGFRFSLYDPNADVLETRADKLEPKQQTVRTLSPMFGARLPKHARLFFQYDFVHDYLGRDAIGVPTDAKNDGWTVRLQVDL